MLLSPKKIAADPRQVVRRHDGPGYIRKVYRSPPLCQRIRYLSDTPTLLPRPNSHFPCSQAPEHPLVVQMQRSPREFPSHHRFYGRSRPSKFQHPLVLQRHTQGVVCSRR